MSPPRFSACSRPSWNAQLWNGKMSDVTLRPAFLWTYSNVPKNSAGVLPCTFVNGAARAGRIRRIDVFMAASQGPVAIAHPLIFFSNIHGRVSWLGTGRWQQYVA